MQYNQTPNAGSYAATHAGAAALDRKHALKQQHAQIAEKIIKQKRGGAGAIERRYEVAL
jgi:hypothetical protein